LSWLRTARLGSRKAVTLPGLFGLTIWTFPFVNLTLKTALKAKIRSQLQASNEC
jgi:hypothetical protein